MEQKTIYALGFFDGVHLGHQALLAECRRLAEQKHCRACAVTFNYPPSAILQNRKAVMLTSAEDRVRLLELYGMDSVTVLQADPQTLSMPWQAFLESLQKNGAVGFVCGTDYRFGSGGEGTARVLEDFCRKRGLLCTVIPEQMLDGEKISSTRIRSLLEEGKPEQASRLLGHPYCMTGQVVSGQQLGRNIGFPTANLQLSQELLTPKLGVYAGKALTDGAEYPAVVNIGTRPTVEGNGVNLEAFLLDFDGDLYGKTLQIQLHAFLRQEKKFPSLEDLKEEIEKNVRQTRNFFGKSE